MVKPIRHSPATVAEFSLTIAPGPFKAACREWIRSFDPAVFLDSNEYADDTYGRYEALVAAGATQILSLEQTNGAFDQLHTWLEEQQDWAFGYFSYDLKNDLEDLHSNQPDIQGFPVLHFFRPQYVLELFADRVRIHSRGDSPELVFQQIILLAEANTPSMQPSVNIAPFRPQMSRETYLETVHRLREHIIAGDIYEINFCQEFASVQSELDPLELFRRLNEVSAAPFSAYYHLGDRHLISASPERFLRKNGEQLISQPIKGTINRGDDAITDARYRQQLATSVKDRAENIMIVDLVRNDLARSCVPGSVQVSELCGIYPFRQVHQMISTIEGRLRPEVHYLDALKAAFPMGSMTGAPKVMSMQLIEQYERSRRGLYSGAVGYITPEGDFDFNVVIRSLFYRSDSHVLSYQVGGAIVYDSDPSAEYAECLLKASGILRALGV